MIIFLKNDFLEKRAIRKISGDLFQIHSLTHETWGEILRNVFIFSQKRFCVKNKLTLMAVSLVRLLKP